MTDAPDQTLEQLRWRTVLLVFGVAALAMSAQVVLNFFRDDAIFPSIVLLSAFSFGGLALAQAALKRASPSLERAGLIVAILVFLLHYTRMVAQTYAGNLQGDTLVEIIPWLGVVYTATFFFFSIRQALVVAGAILIFVSGGWAAAG